MALAPVYGLAPQFTGSLGMIFLVLTSLLIFLSMERLPMPPVALSGFAVALGLCLAVFSCGGTSFVWEKGLGLAAVGVYALALIFRSGRERGFGEKIRFAVLTGAWVTAAIALGSRLFFARSGLQDLAMGNPNVLGFHLSCAFPIAAYQRLRSGDRSEKYFYAFIMAALAAALIVSRSWGACFTGFLAVALLFGKRRWIYPVLGAGLAIVALKAFRNPESLSHRFEWQRAGAAMFFDSPLWGTAMEGGYGALYPIYRSPDVPLRSNYSHNMYIEFLSHWGLIGASLLLGAAYSLWKQWPRPLPADCQAVFAVILLSGFYDSSVFLLPNAAAVTALALSYRRADIRGPALSFGAGPMKVALVFAAAAALALAGELFMARYHLLRGGLWLSLVESSPAVWAEVRRSLARSLRWDLRNQTVWDDLAHLEFTLSREAPARLPRAFWAERRAAALEPWRKEYWRTLNHWSRLEAKP